MALVHQPDLTEADQLATAGRDARVLIAELADPQPSRRRAAALDLGSALLPGVANPDPSGAANGDGADLSEPGRPALGRTAVTDALLRRVAVEPTATVRHAVLTVLAGFDSPEVAAGLAPHLHSDDAGLRVAVADAMAAMPVGVAPLLPHLVSDTDPDERIMTAMLLAGMHHPQAVTWLEKMVAYDPAPNVVGAALNALLPLVEPGRTQLLTGVRRRFPNDPFLTFTVDAALAS